MLIRKGCGANLESGIHGIDAEQGVKLKIAFRSSEIGLTIHWPCGAVWDIMTDTNCWSEWGPSVIAVDCVHRYIRKGTQGRVKVPLGIWVPFVIPEFDDKRYWSWAIWGIRATGHKLEPFDERSCNIFFEVPTLAIPYLLVCRIALKRIEAFVKNAM
jgi:hypothetical protein